MTSAVPRSWWTPPASYVVLKYCHFQNRSNLESTFHQQKKGSRKKRTTSGTAALGDDLPPVATHASLKQCFDKNPLSASTCTSMESKVTRHSYLHSYLDLVLAPAHSYCSQKSQIGPVSSRNANGQLVKSSQLETIELQGEDGAEE